jgi:glycosyltransferase involved in cell wall biosynthesis
LTKNHLDMRLTAARRVFQQIDLFVAPSPSMAREFERLGIDPAKIRTSDYGFVPLLRGSRNGDDGSRRPLRIGYVGTLVWHKGAHVLLEAVRGLPAGGYQVKIFGNPDVSPDYVADLHARAAGLPIQFMGPFERNRIAEAYAAIDVLVVPSLWLENSPLVIHEAFMAGIPVVGARIGGIADLVEEGRTGLLYEPASAVALEAALRGLIENPARLKDMALLARMLPRIKSIADDAREWEDRYAELLSPRRVASSRPAAVGPHDAELAT